MILPSKNGTDYAPAERVGLDVIQSQFDSIRTNSPICQIIDAIPEIVLIINPYRQIVYANKTFYDLLKIRDESQVLGQRPGEVLNCVNAFDHPGGCGTSEFCKTCGAVNALLTSFDGEKSVQECRISRRNNLESLEFKVSSTPYIIDSQQYSIFVLTDQRHENRRRALERIFFHDVMNTAGGLLGYTELLKDAQPEKIEQYREKISILAVRMIEEIKSQQELSQAESNELTLNPANVNSKLVLHELYMSYHTREEYNGIQLSIDPQCESVDFISDETLVCRVIGNMVKNALEASNDGESVTMGCAQTDDTVQFWVHNPHFIPRDLQLQIFQRSFSTKGKGRGLGTYSMRLLTERYLQGKVSFTTSEADGTTFYVNLPLSL
jgi:nitrogen-specific signal transduction histidine kinase